MIARLRSLASSRVLLSVEINDHAPKKAGCQPQRASASGNLPASPLDHERSVMAQTMPLAPVDQTSGQRAQSVIQGSLDVSRLWVS
jgi:hypothetical protein